MPSDYFEKHILDLKKFFRPGAEELAEEVEELREEQPDASELPAVEQDEGGRAVMWEQIGRWCVLIAIALTPIFFLPLTASPVDANKEVVVAFLALGALVSFLATVILRRRIRYPHSRLSLAVLVFLAVTALSAVFSKAPAVSFSGGLSAPDAALSILAAAILFFVSFSFLDRSDAPAVGLAFFGGIALATIFNVLSLYGRTLFPWDFAQQAGFNTVGSFFGWGVLLTAVLGVLAAAPRRRLSRRGRWILLCFGALALFSLFALNYQALWALLAFLMIVIAAIRFAGGGGTGMPLALVVIALFFALTSRNLQSIVQIPIEVRPNLASTMTVARETLSGARIFLGSGPATFGYDWSLFRPIETNQTNFWSFRFSQGYNFAFTALATTGVVGFLAFLFFIVALLRALFRSLDDELALLTALPLLAFAVSFFLYPLFFAQLALFSAGLGYFVSISGSGREVSFARLPRWRTFGAFLGVIACIALALAGGYAVGRKYVAAAEYARALREIDAGSVDQALVRFDRIVALDPNTDEYWRAASQTLLLKARDLMGQGAAAQGNPLQPQLQAALSNAIRAAGQATVVNPIESLAWANAGSVYENLLPLASGADRLAEEHYRRALTYDPKNPQLQVNIARTAVAAADLSSDRADRQEKLQRAEAVLTEALTQKSDYAPAHFLLAQVYIREGDEARAIQKSEDLKAVSPFDPGVAFQLGVLYYQAGRLNDARSEFERAVSLSPDYSNARYFLGLVYDRRGLRAEAIREFERIQELNPDNSEVRTILANLRAARSALQGIVPPLAPPESRTDAPVSEGKTQ